MKGLGGILAVIGVIVVVIGLVNHFVKNFLGNAGHASLIIAVVGAVVLVLGLVMYMMPGKARA